MQIVIFTYDRREKLTRLIDELLKTVSKKNITVIDDGSDWSKDTFFAPSTLTRFPHTGKKGFYKKWDFAIDYCLASKHNDFLFLPDDIENLNMGMIQKIIKQGWSDVPYVVNLINDGRDFCWGRFRTGQMPIEIDDTVLNEVGFTDCGFLSNRHTMEQIKIDRVQDHWFDRPDKSSGVGHQLTKKMRKLGVKMLMPTPSLCTHGDHESKMHKEHRKKNPLISK
jgi:glycosyltransferase involved in cell wall biosynthesis